MNEAEVLAVSVDFSSSEIIQPLVIVPRIEGQHYRPCLQYIPSIKCFVYLSNRQLLTFANGSNFATHHSIRIHQHNDDVIPSIFSLHSEKNMLVLGVPHVYFDCDHRIPSHVQFVKVPQNLNECEMIRFKPTQFIKPYLYKGRIHQMKFFPDGSRLIVAYSNADSWCKIFTLSETLDDETNDSEEWTDSTEERWSVPRNSKTVPYEEIDIFKQGFPIIDEIDERVSESETKEEYYTRYNARYFASNLDNGYFCLAISPDTTRILAGTNDAEIYVIDSTTLKVLHCKREYGYWQTVTGCQYNPLFGHEEFAVCNEIGVFDIWNITTFDDGSEEASKIHHLKFPPGTSNCVYSPDGQFIALTSGKEAKTYIVSSTTANVMFILLYPQDPQDSSYDTYYRASSLFYGNLCQVATYHDDHVICLWKLPIIYSLKTLCLIFLRASIKYVDIEELCLPTSLKLRLKYLYV